MASTEAMPQIELAQWTERIHRSELQNVLTGTKPAISFALGLPAPELFPVTDIAEAVEEVESRSVRTPIWTTFIGTERTSCGTDEVASRGS